jgi:hypothetical protein
MRAHAGPVHGMTCVKNPAMMRTPDKMLPPPPTKRGSRCRPSGRRRISHTAETTIAKPLRVQSNARVASADPTADHSRNTSTPALVVAKPKTRNAVPISRSRYSEHPYVDVCIAPSQFFRQVDVYIDRMRHGERGTAHAHHRSDLAGG